VIERYRTVTASKDYYGDSVLNSVADVVCMAAGFWLARRLPVWASVAVVLGFEALTVWLIRDGLALNVLMLLWPVEAVRDWQAVAAGADALSDARAGVIGWPWACRGAQPICGPSRRTTRQGGFP
jgi:hypothetical protein